QCTTSAVPAQRAISAGRLSTMPFQTVRAASYPASLGRRTVPCKPVANLLTTESSRARSPPSRVRMRDVVMITLPSRRRDGREATPIALRAHTERAAKRDPHRLRSSESARAGDVVHAARRLLEQPPCGFDPDALDEPPWRHAQLAYEDAKEVPRAHRDASGERLDAEVGIGMLDDPGLKLPERVALGGLSGQQRAELCLTAGTLQEEDHPLRHLQRRATAEVLFHQRQREIETRGAACRGVDAAGIEDVEGAVDF